MTTGTQDITDNTHNTAAALEQRLQNIQQQETEASKVLEELLQARHLQNDQRSPTRSLLHSARRLFYLSKPRQPRPHGRKGDILDAEISRKKEQLSWLKLKRTETTTELAKRRVSPSACHRLPPELWSTIFQFCLPHDEIFTRPDVRSAPLLMCGVSRFWRTVAISTPSLWTSLSISRNWRKRPQPALLKQWIQRAGSLPLSLDVALTSPLKPHAHAYHDYAALQIVLSCTRRWQRLRINVPDDYLLQTILDRPMPLLQTLEFSSKCAIGELTLSPLLAPNLRSVSLLTAPLDPTPLLLPWDQLTSVSSRFWMDVDAHLEVMRRTPHLESIRLHILHAHCPGAPTVPPLVMDKMKLLEVVALNGSAMQLILDRLQLPSIEELRLDVPEESPEYGASGWPKDAVISLVDRSACGMLRVFLNGIDISVTGDNCVLPLK